MSKSNTSLKIGAVTYLNSKPLIEDLAELLPAATLRLDYPSRLADDLGAGRLDVALIPSIEYFRLAEFAPCRIVSDACVATHGAVRSVKLYTRVPWREIKTLALDEGSRTSATLARIMLHERFGLTPRRTTFPLGSRIEETTADAVLMIGDRAMSPPLEQFHDVWDLGEEWHRHTGLPFVFAMWVASGSYVKRQDQPANLVRSNGEVAVGQENELEPLVVALAEARDRGVARCEAIAAREAPALGLAVDETIRYFTENLFFTLGPAERQGLELYYRLAASLRLAPSGVCCEFRDPAVAR
ncbi:MAG: hypothetical protein C0478_03885 [Planctomyces sp.]|nr:hypothetical protein [Planctomyces sp.]